MRIETLGDSALQITLGDAPDDTVRRRIAAAGSRISKLPGVIDCVPGFTTLTVHVAPGQLADPTLRAQVELLASDEDSSLADEDRLIEIPVRYGGPDGPDLASVAEHAGLTPEEVVRIHASSEYRVHLIGFIPGFPYLGGLDPRIAARRRDSPRTSVPAGSVGIGGGQTGVYPLESPGGWQIIGRTSELLFDARREPPSLLRAGDRVRFVPIEVPILSPSVNS
jgi:inhibitor of KinA